MDYLSVISLFVAAGGLMLELVVGVVAAVWCLSKFKEGTSVLRATIEHLTSEIQRLREWLEDQEHTSREHGERIARLESRNDS